MKSNPFKKRILALALLAVPGSFATAQQGGSGGQGVDREATWPAPTAEDWKRPVLITFQRTWEDALAVSRETKRPILVCINMDGEIASEHYAGVRYRQPDIARLYEPYVAVIASVYRHNPRDHDLEGKRILCPRFGSVTCGEHIAIEPILFDKFMDDRRIAPRHIMVELDGKETYDVYYAWDTASVFKAIEDGIANRKDQPPVVVRGDRPITERVASRDIQDRKAVETAYEQGDRELKRALLEAAIEHGEGEPVGLLRLAVFGLDVELSKLARTALAQAQSEGAADLINEALRVPMEDKEREALVGALQRLGGASPRARTFAVMHKGLASRSTAVDVEKWSGALAGAEYPAPAEWQGLASRLDQAEQSLSQPENAQARLEFAEASLALAMDQQTAQGSRSAPNFRRLMLDDAERAALEAEQLGASGWRLDAVLGLTAYHKGDMDRARERSEAAVKAMPAGEQGRNAFEVLSIFALSRQRMIARAVREKQDWPPEWLTDVHAAYSVISRHPLGTDAHVSWHYDFLKWFGTARAEQVLEEGLARFPESWVLHDRLRSRILAEQGPQGLEEAYEKRLKSPSAPANQEWFAGYASLVAAEFHRRSGDAEKALGSYDRGIGHYERWIEKNAQDRATADHYIALALAGRARIALEARDYERALGELLSSFERKEDAAATLDGLNISPADTAKMLMARLKEQKREDLAATLEEALGNLDPKLLELPAYERESPRGSREGSSNGDSAQGPR